MILSVGRDHARDYQTLFAAAEKLPDIKFVVICSQRNVEGLAVPANVKILFDLSYKEVASWYGRAAAVVVPMKEMHRSSGQMTLTDAMQAGKAIIASDVIGIRHYGLRSEKDALLVSSGNSNLLKRAITRIIDDNELRQRLEIQALKLAKIFTTENYAKNISGAVEWAIDSIKLRPLGRDDLDFARRLRNENRQYFFDDSYISRHDQLKWFENYQKKTDDFMFVLENNRVRVGIGAIYHIDWIKKSAEIGRFVIDKKFRNQGFGKELIKKIEKLAGGEMNLNKLILEVLHQNHSAISLYKKMGYTQDGVRKFAGRTIVKMEKVLQSPHGERK